MVVAVTGTLALAIARPVTPSGDPLDLIVATVDTTVTPQTWRRMHPTDTLGLDGPSWAQQGQLCRAASGTTTFGGRLVRHFAVFVEPHAPADFVLPSDTAAASRATLSFAVGLDRHPGGG